MSAPCKKCNGTGKDATQRHQSRHGCAAEFNSSSCWSCSGTGVVSGTTLTDDKHASRIADCRSAVDDMLRAQGKIS